MVDVIGILDLMGSTSLQSRRPFLPKIQDRDVPFLFIEAGLRKNNDVG